MSFVRATALLTLCYLLSLPLQAQTRLVVALDHSPPYSMVENGERPRGLVLDILSKITKDMPLSIQVVPCTFSRCLRMVTNGEADVISGLLKTPARLQLLDFISPAYMQLDSSFAFYTAKNSNLSIKRYDDLYQKRIAVIQGGAYFTQFDTDSMLDKVMLRSEKTAFDMLLKGRVDVVIAVEETADKAMQSLSQPIHLLKKADFKHTGKIQGYLAISKQTSHPELVATIRQKMAEMAQDGTLNSLLAKYDLPPITYNN